MEPLVIDEVERVLRHQCAALDPDSVPLGEAPGLYLTFDRIAKLAEGAKTRLLDRVDQARPGAAEGKRSTADWDAEKTGTTPGAARAKLDTSKRLHEQPGVDEALAKGELSGEQANAISGAAGADPSAERKLLDDARSKSVKDLRRECDRVRARAHPDPAARRKAIHAGRFCRSWTDAEGGHNVHLRGLPEDFAAVEAVVAKYRHAAFEAARKAGRYDPSDAISYDGWIAYLLAAIGATPATATAPAPAPERFDLPPAKSVVSVVSPPKGARLVETKTFIHIDFETLRTGRTHPGTICDIDGYGPVDLDWVRQHIGESFVVMLLKDGPRIVDLVHIGRSATAEQRSAKEAEGIHCERPGCGCTHNLELHHVHAWSPTRETIVKYLAWLCGHDHDLITLHGHELERGPTGDWIWITPDETNRAGPAPPDEHRGSAAPPEPGPRQLFADPGAA
jgi:hypothetical protein